MIKREILLFVITKTCFLRKRERRRIRRQIIIKSFQKLPHINPVHFHCIYLTESGAWGPVCMITVIIIP